jgi:microcystin-dependent protein
MACTDCFNGCGTPISDECVKYTGPNIPLLGVSTGDPLSKLEAEIVAKLAEFAEGEGILLSDIDLKCDYLETLFGCCQDKTLVNLIQLLVDASCNLKTLIDALAAATNSPYTFNVQCLTGLSSSSTRDDILQAVIDKLCSVSATVDTIYGDYVKATDLDSLIASYLASATVPQYSKMIPYVAYEYYGSLAFFPGGIGSGNWQKIYICNGQTVGTFVTPDKRGRVAVGAIQGVPGGALDSAVDPTIPANAGTNYSIGQKWGSSYVTLTTNQMPAHTHTVIDPGHSHNLVFGDFDARVDGNSGGQLEIGTNITRTTYAATTGISINSAGLSQSHENRQPSIAAYYIMYIP